MANLAFRNLKADEIECRVSTCSEKGVSLLLYKDARCDMNILDETVGAFNWQRHHSRDNANCIVSIYDQSKGVWIEKEDVGTESNTEAVKGLASDSFKRACFNWGIGRELYTAPFIWVKATDCNVQMRNGKYTTYDKFTVKELHVDENHRITGVAIYNATTKKICYTWGKAKYTQAEPEPMPVAQPVVSPRDELRHFCKKYGIDTQQIIKECGLNKNSTNEDFMAAFIYAQSLIVG